MHIFINSFDVSRNTRFQFFNSLIPLSGSLPLIALPTVTTATAGRTAKTQQRQPYTRLPGQGTTEKEVLANYYQKNDRDTMNAVGHLNKKIRTYSETMNYQEEEYEEEEILMAALVHVKLFCCRNHLSINDIPEPLSACSRKRLLPPNKHQTARIIKVVNCSFIRPRNSIPRYESSRLEENRKPVWAERAAKTKWQRSEQCPVACQDHPYSFGSSPSHHRLRCPIKSSMCEKSKLRLHCRSSSPSSLQASTYSSSHPELL